jgi:hypothetical protein
VLFDPEKRPINSLISRTVVWLNSTAEQQAFALLGWLIRLQVLVP